MNYIHLSTPEEADVAARLETTAQGLEPGSMFQTALEKRLQAAFQARRPAARSLWKEIGLAAGGAAALVALALLLNWAIRLFIVMPQPAIGDTPMPSAPSEQAPIPDSTTYDWHGTSLSINVPLPESPAQANIYLAQPEQPANTDSARVLAAQFGMNGKLYETPGELPDTTNFLVVDGNQRLYVRSDQYFQFYPDYPRWNATLNGATPPPDFEAQIDRFLEAHGVDFPYRIQPSELYGGYLALLLTPDGSPVCYEHFKCAGLRFTLDEKGILAVDGALPKYEAVGLYEIISAEDAFQTIFDSYNESDPAGVRGMLEGMHSPTPPIPTWLRPRPEGQTITVYGWLGSMPSLEGNAPLVSLDGYTVTGNTADVPASLPNTFVSAVGQFHEQGGVRTFEMEAWQAYDGYEDGLTGAINRQGEQIILRTSDGDSLLLPDVPAELPLPLENAFVIGVRRGDTLEWKSIDLRQAMGGGGGGGIGFYKLNLTGTPVPFPTPESASQFSGGGGGGGGAVEAYLVQSGDTLYAIATANGITIEELMQLNDMTDPSELQVGQTLILRSEAMSLPKTVEGLRGMLSITIYKQADGSQRVEYGFMTDPDPYAYLLLEGEALEPLQTYQNRPVDVWGTLEIKDGQPILKVERYELPFPDLQFQILRGVQETVMVEEQPATLFTTSDGQTYVQLSPGGTVDGSTVGHEKDEILLEALIIPGETFGGYPALHIFSASPATNPKTGQPWELPITANQIYTVDEASEDELTQPTAAIERIELVYYMPDPRYATDDLEPDESYLQPAWLFSGHYSDGSEFFILVQALEHESLLPEVAPYTQPG